MWICGQEYRFEWRIDASKLFHQIRTISEAVSPTVQQWSFIKTTSKKKKASLRIHPQQYLIESSTQKVTF